jgi:hypothetical protein
VINPQEELIKGSSCSRSWTHLRYAPRQRAGADEDKVETVTGESVSADELEEMGPIDYLVIEWPDGQPTGEAAPILVDLVDRGLIRVLDLAFIAKGQDGSVTTLELSSLAAKSESLKELAGASSGLLSDEDAAEAATALEPGSTAALLVYENRWAAPFATALRRSGAQLVANGRIPVQAILAALDAAEESESTTS